jgi:hypothetical protein
MKLSSISLLLLIVLLGFACSSSQDNQSDNNPDVSNVKVNLNIQRFDKELFACQDKTQLLTLFNKHKDFVEMYFQTSAEGFSALADKLFPVINNQGLRAFYDQSQEPTFFGNQRLENDLLEAFKHLKYYYPTFKEPKIYTIFSGFFGQGLLPNRELIISDSVIVIGMDYFMGKKGKFLPDIYDYQLSKTSPETVVPQLMLLLSAKYNATNPQDKTLLADMVWYGKSYVFGHSMMPMKDDSLFIGYSGNQLNDCYQFQKDIWAHFIDNKLLYAIEEPLKAKYLGERPTTSEIGSSCPGGIGRWLGWRIVGKYYDADDKLTLPILMQQTDAQKIFENAKYKGLPDEE